MSSVSFSSTVSETLHAFRPQLQTLQPISKGFKNKKNYPENLFALLMASWICFVWEFLSSPTSTQAVIFSYTQLHTDTLQHILSEHFNIRFDLISTHLISSSVVTTIMSNLGILLDARLWFCDGPLWFRRPVLGWGQQSSNLHGFRPFPPIAGWTLQFEHFGRWR